MISATLPRKVVDAIKKNEEVEKKLQQDKIYAEKVRRFDEQEAKRKRTRDEFEFIKTKYPTAKIMPAREQKRATLEHHRPNPKDIEKIEIDLSSVSDVISVA